jgi:hypothetical protein
MTDWKFEAEHIVVTVSEDNVLSMARQLPEVRALVEAMGPMLKWAQQKPVTDKQHRQFDRDWYAARDALAPFEDADAP